MKTLIIIVATIILVVAAIQLYGMSSRNKIETYPYTVKKVYDDFEIRDYEASLFTSVKMNTNDYNKASSSGFRVLAGYIFGGNDKNEKIAMTSPVAMSLEDSMTMMFMVPRSLTRDELPKPNSESINFEEVPAKKVAAIQFGGWANSKKIEKYKQKLLKALDLEGIAYTDRSFFLGYNPPYDLVDRRNEVIIELVN
jgi:hypothetical protein